MFEAFRGARAFTSYLKEKYVIQSANNSDLTMILGLLHVSRERDAEPHFEFCKSFGSGDIEEPVNR